MSNARPCLAAAFLLPVLLAACSTARPPAGVAARQPANWQAPSPAVAHGGAVPALADWWRQLDDPVLVELIGAAQDASPGVSQAASRIAQARATRVAAGAALQPGLDGTASATRGNTQQIGVTTTTVQAGLQAAWEIDLFGANRATADAAQARLQGAQANWHDARVAVAAETANTYLGLRSCLRQLEVTGNDARSRAETARLTQLSTAAGFIAPASAALTRASAAEAAVRLTQQRAQCDTELKGLVALTALEESVLRQQVAPASLDPGRPVLFSIASVPAELLAQRPDVYQAELEVAAASAEVGAARADRYPRLSLSGSVAAGRVRVAGATADAQTWSIGPLALSLPLFDGGRRAAGEDAARARYQDAVVQYRGRVRQAVSEVERALVALDSATSRNDDAVAAAEGFRTSFVATEASYRAGLASLFDLEDARRTLLSAETALVSLQRERAAAWVQLYRATGGGWRRGDAAPAAAAPATP